MIAENSGGQTQPVTEGEDISYLEKQMSALAQDIHQDIHDFVRTGFNHTFGEPSIHLRPDVEWKKVRDVGTNLWLDTGDKEEATDLWNEEFLALTTNNTLLNREIQKGLYDRLVGEAAGVIRSTSPHLKEQDLILEIAFALNAYHGLRLVEQFDAHVSVELHTDLANDVENTVAYGKRFFAICPDRFIVKVPLTPAGLLGARRLILAGVPINFTLGFSARQNVLAALLTKPTWVNVFLGRLNAFVADAQLGDGKNVGEKTVLATQRALLALRDADRSDTRLIGASIRNGKQVADITGIDVQTMPPAAAREYRENPAPRVVSHIQEDPEVALQNGISLKDFNGGTLWEVPDSFHDAIDTLLLKDLDALTPEALRQHFEQAGIPGFLPNWSDMDIQTITNDGKIPIYATWKDRLSSGQLGLDALMNMSALRSFATDQKALDDRIRSLLNE